MNTRVGLSMLVALLVAACGPVAPVQTDVKEAGQDVFFGVPTPPPSPPPLIIQLNPVQTFPTLVEQPPAVSVTAPTPNPCPDLSPLAVPVAEATVLATHPPTAGTYPFRHQGSITTSPGTTSQKVVTLPPEGTRQVANVSALGPVSDYSFDEVDTYNNVKTTTSYHVYPQGTATLGPAGAVPGVSNADAGVYITAIVMSGGGQNGPACFHPASPGVEIFPFPATPGATWEATGTDPLTQTTMVIGPTASPPNPQGTGTVVDRQRVNACGTALDAWQATMQGTIQAAPSGPNSSNTFTLTIEMATQFGGLILGDNYTETYNDANNVNTVYSVGATIDVVPSNPAA